MPIIATESKNYPPAAAGIQQGVIAKVVDLGIVEGNYKGKPTKAHKIQIIWQVAEKDDEGQPKRVNEFFTLSTDEKSNLRKRMINLFGQPAPAGFDYEKLVGTQRVLVISHSKSKDGSRTYANVDTTTKLTPGQAKLEIVPFELKKKDDVKQVANTQQLAGTAVTAAAPITDDDVPF
jgi:hypothetical protein